METKLIDSTLPDHTITYPVNYSVNLLPPIPTLPILHEGTYLWVFSNDLEEGKIVQTNKYYVFLRESLSFDQVEEGQVAQFTAWIVYDPSSGLIEVLNPLKQTISLIDPETAHVNPRPGETK